MSIILGILGSIATAIGLFILLVIVIGYLLSCRPYSGPVSAHFNGKKFINPSRRPAKGFKEVGRYGRERVPDKWRYVEDPDSHKRQIPTPNSAHIQYTFINHSSFLIQWNGINILTDSIWSKRCSPFQWAGPRRMRPPGINYEHLPPIHLILISHNHYDHLDKITFKKLVKDFQPKVIAPLGLAHLLTKWGAKQVTELDWWQTDDFHGLSITATPCNHFSSRGLFDRDKTLWAGYSLSDQRRKIYYTGDTGYSEVFKEIGEKLGPFDLSFIPIGAYKPEWFMSPIHISPCQALQVHHDVKSKKSVAMHFGTFPLADDNPETSTSALRRCLKEKDISEEDFSLPKEGSSYVVNA